MLNNPRAREKIRGFFHHWLEIEERDLAKDRDKFPEFDEAVIADLLYSLNAFVDRVVWDENSDYRQLMMADYLVLNERLRELYDENDAAAPQEPSSKHDSTESNGNFEPTKFAPGRRAGVLTHPYLLSAMAYHNSTSPIHRGVFLTRKVVGRTLRPPPVAVAFENEKFSPDLTMREKITQLTRKDACASCHSVINPLGFALENFDAVGRWRTMENGKPINSTAKYVTVTGETLAVQSARDIADHVVASPHAHRAFVTQFFEHLVKQNPAIYGFDSVQELTDQFAEDGFSIQNLAVRIAVLAATRSDHH